MAKNPSPVTAKPSSTAKPSATQRSRGEPALVVPPKDVERPPSTVSAPSAAQTVKSVPVPTAAPVSKPAGKKDFTQIAVSNAQHDKLRTLAFTTRLSMRELNDEAIELLIAKYNEESAQS